MECKNGNNDGFVVYSVSLDYSRDCINTAGHFDLYFFNILLLPVLGDTVVRHGSSILVPMFSAFL